MTAVIDFVNNGATATAGFDTLRKGGQLVSSRPVRRRTRRLHRVAGTEDGDHQRSFVGTPADLRALVAIAKRGALPRIPVTEAPLNAETVQQSLNKLEQGGVTGRIVLCADASSAA